MNKNFFRVLREHPIIAAIKCEDDIEKAIESPSEIVFLLAGNVLNIKEITDHLKKHNKLVYIHFDLINGLSNDTTALNFIAKNVKPDGIITTKPSIINSAKELGLFTIQRLFLLDSMALQNGINSVNTNKPDAIEIIPGIMPKIIKQIDQMVHAPIIAGGLINDKQDVISALNSGAMGISTSNKEVWNM